MHEFMHAKRNPPTHPLRKTKRSTLHLWEIELVSSQKGICLRGKSDIKRQRVPQPDFIGEAVEFIANACCKNTRVEGDDQPDDATAATATTTLMRRDSRTATIAIKARSSVHFFKKIVPTGCIVRPPTHFTITPLSQVSYQNVKIAVVTQFM